MFVICLLAIVKKAAFNFVIVKMFSRQQFKPLPFILAMENLTKRRKTTKNVDAPSAYGSDLSADLAYQASNSFYVIPPVEEISIEQFENFGIDRVKGTWLLEVYISISFEGNRKHKTYE